MVAGRVAKACVDPVRLLHRLLAELHALRLELLVALLDVVRREEEPAGGAFREQALDLGARVLVEHGRARDGHERDGDVLPGDAHGQPAEVAHLGHRHVLPKLHAELLGIERERLVLVVHPHLRIRELLQHRLPPSVDWNDADVTQAVDLPSSRNLLDCGRAYACNTHVGIRTWVEAGGFAARYAVGESPYVRPKLVVNDPTLLRPTSKQTSATERSVFRRSAAARSSLRVSRYWCGVSPNARRNSRLKCAGDRCASRASASTSSGSR